MDMFDLAGVKVLFKEISGVIRSGVWLLDGTETASGEPLKIIFAGSVAQKVHLSEVAFGGECTEHYYGKLYFWRILYLLRTSKSRCDIAFIEGNRLHLNDVLSNLLNSFTLADAPLCIPCSVANLYERELDRIKSVVESGDPASLGFKLDVRQKDLAILTFRLIPVGAEFAEPWSTIWRRQVLTSRASQILKAINFFMLKRNGFSPYFQLHIHQESHADFHEDGCMQTYGRLAELLEQNRERKGWFSSSWLVDPALEQVSPHLSYLRTVPENNGGAIFYVEDDPTGKTGALATSRARRVCSHQDSIIHGFICGSGPDQRLSPGGKRMNSTSCFH
jgi:hypothetical protein